MMYVDHIRIDPAYRDALRAPQLDRVEDILTRVDGRVVAWSRTTDTLHVPGPDGTPGFYVKRYYYPQWRNRLRVALRGTFLGVHRGQAEWRALNAMRSLGIAAVRPVAYGSRRLAHFVLACFLITEEVPGARNLTTVAADVTRGRMKLSRGERVAMIRRLAEQIAEMHAAGFAHGQLFWRNVLVRHGPDGDPEYFFLDAHPPRRGLNRGQGAHWSLRELADLAASALPFTTRTDRMRFLWCYFGTPRLTATLKPHIREITRLAGRWRRHEAQRIKMNELFEEWNRQLVVEGNGP